jgi:hypothetical protein
MVKMGFDSRWIQLIMTYIQNVMYSILINEQPHGNIIPTQGLQQGDPLSPYLFILCAEGLEKAMENKAIYGMPITRMGVRLSHLFFANDSLLFCKANLIEWQKLQKILEAYEKAFGQRLNRSKTSIFFNKDTLRDTHDGLIAIAGVPST